MDAGTFQARVEDGLVAIAPQVQAGAAAAQHYLMADSLVRGIPNLALAAGAVALYATMRPFGFGRRRRRRRARYTGAVDDGA